MKHSISFRFVLGAAILAYALSGGRSLQCAVAQTPPTLPANTVATASSENAPEASALPPDIAPDSPLAQIIRLVQAGVEQSVILTYLNDSTNLFNLDADKIIYLNDLGVPTALINAMMQHDQQLEQNGVAPAQSTPPANPAETETAAQPAEVTVNYFYNTLAPYGAWVDVAGYGWCWRPTVVIYDAGWQPYCNNGHWVYTDCGWYWISGYSWGWAPFHYGRWFRIPRYGWCWQPGTTWAPSWVCWRHDRDYCGWAPLPPRAIYRSGVGFFYDGHKVSAGFNFGLSAGDFTFVATRDFYSSQPWQHRLQHQEAERAYRRTTVIHNFDFDRHNGRIVNVGIPLHDITAVTRQQIHPITLRDEDRGVAWGGRREQFEHDGRTLVVNHPHFVGSPVLSLRHGTGPDAEHRQNEFRPTVYPATPAQNNSQHRELNQNPRPNFNQGAPRTFQITPAHPSQQNEFHPAPRGNENNVSPHHENPAQNHFQPPGANWHSTPNFNHAVPQPPQNQRPEVHVITPNPQGHNNAVGTPHENYSPRSTQNRAWDHNYNYPSRVLSSRAQEFEQQAPHNAFHGSQQQGTAVNEWREQHFAAPSANHYPPPASQRQDSYHQPRFSAPRNEARNGQRFNHSEPPPHSVEPHTSYHASPSSSHQSHDQSRDNGQRGH